MQQYLPVAQAGVPLLFWGPPGSGKSASVQSWCRLRDLHVEVLIGSLADAGDVLGYALSDGQGGVDFAMPGWFRRLQQQGNGVLFLDEINRGSRAVRSAMLRIVAERKIHGHATNFSIVAAANEDGEVDELDAAMKSRFCHLHFTVSPADFVRQFRVDQWDIPAVLPPDWEASVDLYREIVGQFILARPELMTITPKLEDLGFPCARTWELSSRALAACDSLRLSAKPVLAGLLGEGTAKEFSHWQTSLDLPAPDDVLSGKWNPGSRDQQRAALLSIVPLVKNAATWDAAWDQIARCRKDVAVLVARKVASRRPPRCKVPVSAAELIEVVL